MYKLLPILLFTYGFAVTADDIYDNSYALIIGIDKVIHVEVAKLYHEPNLPEIDAQIIEDGFILMRYNSKRQLCMCAEGLIFGAAAHYGVDAKLNHAQCMHDGFDSCLIEIKYETPHG